MMGAEGRGPDSQSCKLDIVSVDLRDGQQTPGIRTISTEEAVMYAQQLEAAGFAGVEAGFAVSSPAESNKVLAVAKATSRLIVCSLARVIPGDIEAAGQAIEPAISRGVGRIHTYAGTSPSHLIKNKTTPENVLRDTASEVSRAATIAPTQFSPEDATRSEQGFLMKVVLTAVENGATIINVPDTVGFSHPTEYKKLMANIKHGVEKRFGSGHVVFSAHCHNDQGLAVANTLAGVEAGANQIEGTMNGNGERTGNVELATLIAAIEVARPGYYTTVDSRTLIRRVAGGMFGRLGYRQGQKGGQPLRTGVDPAQLNRLARLTSELTGIPVRDSQPAVGCHAFTHTGGTHHAAQEFPEAYQVISDPSYVGHPGAEQAIGELTGRKGVGNRLNTLCIAVSGEELSAITHGVKAQAALEKRQLFDNEIELIAAEVLRIEIIDQVELKSIRTHGDDETITAEVQVSDQNVEKRATETGVGGIDAPKRAINTALGFEGDIQSHKSVSQGSGSDAVGGIRVVVCYDGYTVSAYAEGRNVDRATAEAYIVAINMIRRIEERSTNVSAEPPG